MASCEAVVVAAINRVVKSPDVESTIKTTSPILNEVGLTGLTQRTYVALAAPLDDAIGAKAMLAFNQHHWTHECVQANRSF
jgi:hypothetical protein